MRNLWSFALGLALSAWLAACFGDEDLGGASPADAGSPDGNDGGDTGAPPSDAPVVCRAYCGTRSPECEERARCETACSDVFAAHPSCAALSSLYFYCRALHDCSDTSACQRELEQSERCYSPMAAP